METTDGTSRVTQPAVLLKAAIPFRFHTSFVVQEATGLRAATLSQLAVLIRRVPESCIYYHTHYFLLAHHYLAPEPANDFAYWTAEVMGERPLGERLAGIDILEHSTLHSLREALADTIEEYLAHTPTARLRFASEGQEMFMIKSVHVIMPTAYQVSTLEEFAQALSHVGIHSLYFHVFDARLRLGHPTNDFAKWFDEELGLRELAEDVTHLDPYAQSLETLRLRLLSLVRHELARQGTADAQPR